ncbi:tail fiber protein [Pectobacterium polaris]|uniref:tail fiber protein n=1 Tax=Pectobacterium polaris TaxID=2042057 RepID=UPI0032F0077D
MNRSSPPKKQPVPFGINGQRENLLPATPAGDNTASYSNGFPPVTMILKAAGGLPPKGQDMNQILFELSDLMRWASTGAINSFDTEFSASIGGYPSGALVLADSGSKIFISVVENNTENPNVTSTGSWKDAADFIGVPVWVSTEINGKLSKDQNGADIPNKPLFAKNAQVPHLGNSWIDFGGSSGAWTTSQFISFLSSQGAFEHLYFVCAGTWSFSANKKITDTNCGHIELAGAVVEVFASRFNLATVRVTTMSASSDPLAVQGQFVYVESETPGSGEWRREFNTKNLTASDIGALQISEIVGMPQPWPLTTIPSGWLPCAGQSFDTAAYPILTTRYPSGVLPDLRGEFIRGWDSGRGVDPARTNLSGQAFATESHTHASGSLEVGSGTPLYVGKGLQDGGGNVYSRTGVNNNAGTETRPRNIAFNYIVRAA